MCVLACAVCAGVRFCFISRVRLVCVCACVFAFVCACVRTCGVGGFATSLWFWLVLFRPPTPPRTRNFASGTWALALMMVN